MSACTCGSQASSASPWATISGTPAAASSGTRSGSVQHRVGHAAQPGLGVAQEALRVELPRRLRHGLRLRVGHRHLLERLVHQRHTAGVQQRPEVVEQVGPPPGQLRRSRAEQRERGEQRRGRRARRPGRPGRRSCGRPGAAARRTPRAAPRRRRGRRSPAPPPSSAPGRPARGTRTGRAGRAPPPGSRPRRAGPGAARSPPCSRCSPRPSARCRGRRRHRCPARPGHPRRPGTCGAARRGRPADAGRRARWPGSRRGTRSRRA